MSWDKEWYRDVWTDYDGAWNQFMHAYIFSKDPPFKIEEENNIPCEDYPGQAYFHANNANIKATEERWRNR